MNALAKPAPFLAGVLAAVFLLLGQYAFAGICLVAAIAALGLGSFRQTSERRESDVSDTLDVEAKTLFVPIKRLSAEISDLVAKVSVAGAFSLLGPEVVGESTRIRLQAAQALQARTEIRRSIRGRSDAVRDLAELRVRQGSAGSDEERRAAGAALAAREQEIAAYDAGEVAIARIDADLRKAEAVLSEIRARLAMEVAGQRTATAESSDELRETVSRMKAVSLSYDEVRQLMNG